MPVTSVNFEVIDLLRIDKEKGWAYYIASPGNATQRYLFRSKLNGKAKPERLSPAEQTGHHSYSISPGCGFAIHTFSNHGTPPVYSVISLPDHKVIRVLEDNQGLKEKQAEYTIAKKEFFRIKTDDQLEFDAWMIKPPDFNPKNNEEGYRDGSPITHAKNLQGNLLLIHGSADDNCHYQSCQMLVNELIKHNKYFTMIDYPMRSHSINERDNTTLHLRMPMLNYFKKNLATGAK